MATASIPNKTNLLIATTILALFILSLTVAPLLLGSYAIVLTLMTVVLIPLNTPLWSLIHEAIHKNFHSNKFVNEIAGRVMSVVFGASFGVLRFGHLMHHQYNREWESEHYTGSRFAAWVKHYFTMLGGLYIIEVVMAFVVTVLPLPATKKVARMIFEDDRHYQAVLNSLLKPENAKKIRTDFLWIVLFYGVVALCLKSLWWIAALSVAGRAVIISIMDNAYHYGTPKDNSVIAKELETSRWYSKFILNFNHHVTHHNHVNLPWTALKSAHDEKDIPYSEKIGPAILAQFKGPIRISE